MKKVQSFSRNLLGLGLFMGSSILMNAQQDLAVVSHAALYANAPTITAIADADHARNHSNVAVAQIRHHILQDLSYTDIASDYDIEGTVVVEISLNDTGAITNTRIIKRLSNDLDEAVLSSINDLASIKVPERTYKGVNTVHIPIRFTNSL